MSGNPMRGDRTTWFRTERLVVSSLGEADIDAFMEYRKVLLREPDFRLGVQLAVFLQGLLIGDLYVKTVDGTAEIGYSLHRRYTGKGYCQEAVAGLCFFLRSSRVSLVRAKLDEANTASIKVLERSGFARKGIQDDCLLYEKQL